MPYSVIGLISCRRYHFLSCVCFIYLFIWLL